MVVYIIGSLWQGICKMKQLAMCTNCCALVRIMVKNRPTVIACNGLRRLPKLGTEFRIFKVLFISPLYCRKKPK